MNIDELTISQAKEIMKMINFSTHEKRQDIDFGLVVCQFIGRFVFVANLSVKGGYCYLTNVRNIRYWAKRENGLGELARKGEIDGDKIDKWPDQIIPLDKLGPVMKASKEHWS